MTRQRVLVAVAVWLAVVAGVSALVWVVISRAGDDLVASGGTVVSTDAGQERLEAGRDGAPTRRPGRTPSSPGSPTASPTGGSATPTTPVQPSSGPAEPSQTPSGTPSASPTGTSQPGGPGGPGGDGGNGGSGGDAGGSGGTASSSRRTWQGEPGTVVASCVDGRARLVSAQPATGFRAEVHQEDAALEVDFEGREDGNDSHVTVVARCSGGVPAFSTRSESSGDD